MQKILGFLNVGLWYLPSELPDNDAIGSNVGCDLTVEALLKYGSFEEVHFIGCGNPQNANVSQKIEFYCRLKQSNLELKVIPWGAFLQNLKEDLYHSLYLSYLSFRKFHEFIRFNTPGINTSFIGHAHGMDPNFMQFDFLHNALFPLTSKDGIICSSSCVKILIQNKIKSINDTLGELTGRNHIDECRLPIIPFGVDTDLFKIRDKRSIRNELNLPLDKILLLSMGRLSANTKCDMFPLLYAIKVIKQTNASISNFKLIISGTNKEGYHNEILRLIEIFDIKDLVECRFNISNYVKRHLYSACDIFVSLVDNFGESFGISMIEALASGLPIIGTDWDGYKDLIIDGFNGYKVPVYWSDCVESINMAYLIGSNLTPMLMSQTLSLDYSFLISKLQMLINDDNLRNEISHNSVNIANEKYSNKIYGEKLNEFFMEKTQNNVNKAHVGNNNVNRLKELLIRNYYKDYCHYSTRNLNGDQFFRISRFGYEMAKNFDILKSLINSHYSEYLNSMAIKDYIENERVATFGNFCEVFSKNYNLGDDESKRHFMWMLKYNLIELAT